MLILWVSIFTCSYAEYTYKWHAHASACRHVWRPEVICSCRLNKEGKQWQCQIMMNAVKAFTVKRQNRGNTEKVTLCWDLVGAQHRTGRAYRERKTHVILLDQWWAGPSNSTLEHARGNCETRSNKDWSQVAIKKAADDLLVFLILGEHRPK